MDLIFDFEMVKNKDRTENGIFSIFALIALDLDDRVSKERKMYEHVLLKIPKIRYYRHLDFCFSKNCQIKLLSIV